MNTYLVESSTNYGLMVHVVNADSFREAEQFALKGGAWEDCTIRIVDTTKPGVVLYAPPDRG